MSSGHKKGDIRNSFNIYSNLINTLAKQDKACNQRSEAVIVSQFVVRKDILLVLPQNLERTIRKLPQVKELVVNFYITDLQQTIQQAH